MVRPRLLVATGTADEDPLVRLEERERLDGVTTETLLLGESSTSERRLRVFREGFSTI